MTQQRHILIYACIAAVVVCWACVCHAQSREIPLRKSYSPYGLAPALKAMAENIEQLHARTRHDYPAGCHLLTKPLTYDGKHGLTITGPSGGLMDPRGWCRAWWAKNPESRCILLFDIPEGVPCFHFKGCRAVTVSGVNVCRTTAGPLFQDERSDGQNSGEIRFERVGFYRRTDAGNALADPFGGAGFKCPAEGTVGLRVVGNNGADNYHFRDCDFAALDRAIDIDCPQTTRVTFTACNFRRCQNLAWCKRSGNLSFYGCQSYDSGSVVYERCGIAVCSMLWSGGWLDWSAKGAPQPLADFSRTDYGHLTYVGGNGKQWRTSGNRAACPPLVIMPRQAERLTLNILGPLPYGQETCETR